jgi:hypothetical protein
LFFLFFGFTRGALLLNFCGALELVLLLSAGFPKLFSSFFFAVLKPDGLFLL